MTPESINQAIKRQLINPSLDMSFCERVLQKLDSKSETEKKELLETLKESMDIFKQEAKETKAPMLYKQLCDKVKDKIQRCKSLFQVTLEDILTVIDDTNIRIFDVAWEYLSPMDITEMICKKVLGQRKYATALGLAVYQHLLRSTEQGLDIPKTNLLVYGPTGVGKTYSVQVLSRLLNIDFQVINCNTLVQEGIIGTTVSDALTHAYIRNNKITHLIIFLDEFDKLFKDGYYNSRILQELLAYLDDDGEISYRTKFGSSDITYKKFPTRNILVIMGGVFDGLKDIVEKRISSSTDDFTNRGKKLDPDFYGQVTKEDFAQLFKNNELLGRIGQFVRVQPMSREMLLDIVKSETASPLVKYTNYFARHGMTVTLTDDGAGRIVDIVRTEGLGVRGLKSVLGTVLQEDMAQVKHNSLTNIEIDEQYVTGHLPEYMVKDTDNHTMDTTWEQLSPQKITEMIDKEVVGQKEYTSALGLAAYQHILRCKDQEKTFPKTNLLVYGPTGVGKTYSIHVLSRLLNIDFHTINCNALVQEGFIGLSISNALTRAYIKNKEFTHMILFFDNFDELFKNGYSNMLVLQEVLTYLEDDGEVSFRTNFGDQDVTFKKFPTRNLLVVLGGVFNGLKGIVEKRVFPTKMGFTVQQIPQDFNFYEHVRKVDFARFFKNDELLGRIGRHVRANTLSRGMLLDIIKSETASPLIPYSNYFKHHNITVTLTDEGTERIVDIVLKEKLGVRGLKSVLGAILQEDMARVENNSATHIKIDGKYVSAHFPEYSDENLAK